MADASQPSPSMAMASPWIQPRTKFLVQMSGPPGAGKSTLAKTLACRLRVRHGLGAVVVNHDLIKDFFVDPGIGGMLSGGEDSGAEKKEGKGCGQGISFADAARLSYRLDWVLVWDMFEQGQDVVILDSVCNYREAVENGLGLVGRWNSGSGNGNRSEGADMVYLYVECRFGDGNLEALDKRLKERAERGDALRSQRVGVFEGPVGDIAARQRGLEGGNGGASGKEATIRGDPAKEEEVNNLFRKWMNPARPTESDGATVVVVDSKTTSPRECVDVILSTIGV